MILVNCARKGRPEGGPKDENAPIFVTADPPYETTHFSKDEIKIYFDEYIILKDIRKKLIVSPPMKNPPIITPQGIPSKYITINILDTLLENTTYIFNFGSAVQDNNEGNKIENFKYVFSTGSYIDSLIIKGSVKDAFLKKTEKNINVLLYRIDSSFTDSIVFKKKPNYVASTLDSTAYNFTNVKAGKYFLVALKEEISDYLFHPKSEKIGFLTKPIVLPKDSIIATPLVLFEEQLPYKFKRAKEITKGKLQFSFLGVRKDITIKVLSKVPESYKSIYHLDKEKDTIYYWFTPLEIDSLNFVVSNKNEIDTVTVKFKKKKIDSLIFSPSTKGALHFKDTFFIETNNPILQIDITKIQLIDKDTLKVPFHTLLSEKENKINFLFDKEEDEKYVLTILPNSLTDIFFQQNDTLKYQFRTKKKEEYGTLLLNVKNPKSHHLIIELLSERGKVVRKKYLSISKIIKFDLLLPKKYIVRATIDSNYNRKWDTGNFLKQQQPETIIYYPDELEIRANWHVNQTLVIEQ